MITHSHPGPSAAHDQTGGHYGLPIRVCLLAGGPDELDCLEQVATLLSPLVPLIEMISAPEEWRNAYLQQDPIFSAYLAWVVRRADVCILVSDCLDHREPVIRFQIEEALEQDKGLLVLAHAATPREGAPVNPLSAFDLDEEVPVQMIEDSTTTSELLEWIRVAPRAHAIL